ncbi:MAG TPA: phosphatidylglycerophosphatase A [Lacipirellula sp.]
MNSDLFSSPRFACGLASRLSVWLATGVGIGLVTPAPGTVAGLWGVALAAAIDQIPERTVEWIVIAVLVVLAIPLCKLASDALLSDGDPGPIALDEIVALPIVFIGVDGLNWPRLIAGYLLFRLCDVLKPWPARQAERLPGGLGIVADDCVAAVMACLLLHGALWVDERFDVNWLTSAA